MQEAWNKSQIMNVVATDAQAMLRREESVRVRGMAEDEKQKQVYQELI